MIFPHSAAVAAAAVDRSNEYKKVLYKNWFNQKKAESIMSALPRFPHLNFLLFVGCGKYAMHGAWKAVITFLNPSGQARGNKKYKTEEKWVGKVLKRGTHFEP